MRVIYPPRCSLCGDMVESDFGLCATCWRETPFISGLVCNACGTPLPGEDTSDDLLCDDCLQTTRPWSKGRSTLIYRDKARKLVLALKHGDRDDMVYPAARWMARAAHDLLSDNTLLAPVPLHWTRLLKRRYNQSALLAQALGRELKLPCCPDLLLRKTRTRSLNGLGFAERHAVLDGVIHPNPRRLALVKGRHILLVDDVMTSGATLSACAQACLKANAEDVKIMTLARVIKDV